ncbi:MAG: 3',5'-nucleoside bisphosphate phosphatase [Accumulibacter sp.]|uniref:3',5'-nucleoside bisphosphate phosphatase n=1 Tax=Accumulibacter sp. TaxID=2053492 RepID=UPI001ACF9BE6|nr:3',5'-nucleoside bisphosphate phosphatase [Accumulibacter sp.]MBN8438560.1 PHP domain-containing protein [Accumulibacter sp.]
MHSYFRCPCWSVSVLNCDLHCHSTCSDGLLPAAEVARRAAANGVAMLALTDHDDLDGLPAARAAADAVGMAFVNGVEISIEWEALQIHILGLAFNRADPALNAGLAAIRSGRIERARRMSAELEKVGIAGAFEGAMRFAANPSLVSRAHFGRYLVESGVCKDLRSVFESYLVPGRPGYVDHRWATLSDSLRWILGAGGLAVVAHPGRYKLSRADMRRFLGEFKDLGGQAIEVMSGSHTAEHVDAFGRLAREHDFLASRGSDFHGPGESYVDLGKLAPLPAGLTPVWQAF